MPGGSVEQLLIGGWGGRSHLRAKRDQISRREDPLLPNLQHCGICWGWELQIHTGIEEQWAPSPLTYLRVFESVMVQPSRLIQMQALASL